MIAQQANVGGSAILSVDLGRTATKACVSRNEDSVVLIPANVAHLTLEQVQRDDFEAGVADPLLDLWLEYQDGGYAIGQLAADFGANLGVGQSKLEDALVKVFACVGYFNLKGEINVVVGLPYDAQEIFEVEKEQLTAILQAPHLMFYRGEAFPINIGKVWVVPEGYGSLIWCNALLGSVEDADLLTASVATVDIGHQTTDFLMVDRFRFSRGASRSEVFAMSQFYERVAAEVEGADSQSLLLIKAVHEKAGHRFYRPRGARQPADLDRILPRLRQNFARELCDRLITWLPERATDVIISGGGGEFFWDDLKTLLEEARLRVHLAHPSRKANALGQYIYGELKMAKQGR